MYRFVQVLVASVIFVATSGLGITFAHAGQAVTIVQAWSRATPKGSPVAAGYLTIENQTGSPDRLIEVRSAVAKKVDLHTTTIKNGVSSMQSVQDGLVIPANGSVTLQPGGSHLMFIGLNAPLVEGDHVPVELLFEKAGTISANLDVAAIGSLAPSTVEQPPKPAKIAAVIPATDAFFTHLCGEKLMANVTVSPARAGDFEIFVQLEDAQEQPLAAQALAVTLFDENRRTEVSGAIAERVSADKWRVRMSAPTRGTWLLSLNVQTLSADQIEIAAPILIE
jgi:copper(I)-binding protein